MDEWGKVASLTAWAIPESKIMFMNFIAQQLSLINHNFYEVSMAELAVCRCSSQLQLKRKSMNQIAGKSVNK